MSAQAPTPSQREFSLIAKVELMRSLVGLRLTMYELKTLIVLCSLINQRNGLAYPPRSLISALTGIGERHVTRAIRSLCKQSLVEIIEPGGPTRAARYKINIPKIITTSSAPKGTSDAPLKARQAHLYKHITAASGGTITVPTQEPEGQLTASEEQTKLAVKLSKSRSCASEAPPMGLPRQRTARDQKNDAGKNSWCHSFEDA